MSPSQAFGHWSGVQMPNAGWEYAALRVGDELAAVAALHGTEIHFAASPTWRGRLITRRRLREFLQPLLDRRGYLTTRLVPGADDRFIRRLGFSHTWTGSDCAHFMLTTIPFCKEH